MADGNGTTQMTTGEWTETASVPVTPPYAAERTAAPGLAIVVTCPRVAPSVETDTDGSLLRHAARLVTSVVRPSDHVAVALPMTGLVEYGSDGDWYGFHWSL
jgi:hypothetical protein